MALGPTEKKQDTLRLGANAAGAAKAAALLRAGALVAFPTETVYGLGADAANPRAVAAIYAAKGRPAFNPLIAHVLDLEAARGEILLNDQALALAKKFWPGPMTLVGPAAPGGKTCELARAGLTTLAVRVPDHPFAQRLLRDFGGPIVAPSANLSGAVSPSCADHAFQDLEGEIAAVIDGGPSPIGVESTIIACDGGACVLLRAGATPREAIEAVTGALESPRREAVTGALESPRRKEGSQGADARLQAPGMSLSHYAPRARLRLNAHSLRAGEVGLDFGARLPGASKDLSPSGDVREAAANLYAYLRALDAQGAQTIAVASIPQTGIGEAIADRLTRAAAPRKF